MWVHNNDCCLPPPHVRACAWREGSADHANAARGRHAARLQAGTERTQRLQHGRSARSTPAAHLHVVKRSLELREGAALGAGQQVRGGAVLSVVFRQARELGESPQRQVDLSRRSGWSGVGQVRSMAQRSRLAGQGRRAAVGSSRPASAAQLRRSPERCGASTRATRPAPARWYLHCGAILAHALQPSVEGRREGASACTRAGGTGCWGPNVQSGLPRAAVGKRLCTRAPT